ncbi:leukocyte surface antigen CD53 isoform X2 [Hippocampus zosterae]|uniref:leukocyte surface antigen CD53 isoform X2 n=1 Tax=Hippocampus zosterae TaxID=109293 RepID=UPI00223DA824|nr:leukocyte surface antigen CD53 isoform X2 [Hippocampus zosterae]
MKVIKTTGVMEPRKTTPCCAVGLQLRTSCVSPSSFRTGHIPGNTSLISSSHEPQEKVSIHFVTHRNLAAMTQGCLKCLKYTMCVANFLCFMSGVAVMGFGVYLMVNFKLTALTPSLANFNLANMLLISGIIISCLSFLGFLGALKENRCLLLTFFLVLFFLLLVELTAACLLLLYEQDIAKWVERDLNDGLKQAKGKHPDEYRSEWDLVQKTFDCCGVHNVSDWGDNVPDSCCFQDCIDSQMRQYRSTGCLDKIRSWFEENFLNTGISVIILCIIEVLGMCFAMTLFCHISRSGLGYKL